MKILDGSLADWAASERLDSPLTGASGYALYGSYEAGVFYFAISSSTVAIGQNTTVWLDTDLNRGTGHQIWGFAGGVEYNVNVAADGTVALYSGGSGQNFIANLDYAYSADGTVLEFAVPNSLLAGSPNKVRVFADVNDAAFLPNDYANVDFIVSDAASGGGTVATFGAITTDGDLSDWAPTTRLDNAATGAVGYALYGDVQGGAFVFAISADATVIGANTTIWLDTDLDRTTGYKIWGFAGGAEYNVNIKSDGTAALYSGGAGQNFIADVVWNKSADGKTIEIAIDQALLGGATSARVYADVNDAVYLPNDYTNVNFIVRENSGGTVATYGVITTDGNLADWAPSTRLDSAATGAAGYELYGDLQNGSFVFAIHADSVVVGENTTIWLDTDLNRATGHQIWGFTGGAEYNINFGADGLAKLYSGAAGEVLVSNLVWNRSADGHNIEVAVDQALIGGVHDVRVYADVNDAVFIPNDYSNVNFFVRGATYGNISLNGDLSDWAASKRLDNATTGTAGYALYGDLQGGAFVFAIDADSVAIGQNTTVWLDTDLNRTTGYQIFGFTGGAEYNVNIAADGSAALYTGGAGETLVGSIDWNYSADRQTLEFAVLQSQVGGAPSVRVYADVNDTAFIPNDYSNLNFVVSGTTLGGTFGSITLDGSLADWAPDKRLDNATTGTAGYALYGDVQGGALVFALNADAVSIGLNSTIWLDTDLNRATGYQIWGFTGGAEYNVNLAADGSAALYTGGAGENFITNLAWKRSADGHTLELAVPSSQIGGATSARVYADVNNSAYLPNSYSSIDFIVHPTPTSGSDLRIGIVYSATSAANFYDLTAYGKLFMAAQHQAMQSGIPFDLLTEDDLLDPAALANYDALVFPGFSHVQSSNLAAIENTLTTLSNLNGVSLIAAGNFLTNDETGAALAGDPYARMKALLGVTLEGFGNTSGIDLVAGGAAHPILSSYATGELVGSYSNTSYLSFSDFTGTGQVLFNQNLNDAAGAFTKAGAIATTTGARNVHFASDAIIGNNNILGSALDWVTQDTLPDVSMTMTRGTSLFYSRNDMDQAQETYDVLELNPGIYDVMLPILQSWYQQYGFVGSYYIDIGANPPDQMTDWAQSGVYYNQLLALESEIGSHSWTHPDDTNLLQADSPELLAILDMVDPRNPAHVNPWQLTAEQQQILFNSYRFQFEMSRYEIEQQLGITVGGIAVPGAPEVLSTSREIMKYYDYISGGYSGVGAGYFGSFGYLTPDDMVQEYLAPNMSFDFSLIGFQKLTPAQAEAVWAKEYSDITSNALAPIIAFPWHDYGLTNWDLGDPVHLNYTLQMFENVVARAYADGAEFVTGAELASRIESFAQSSLALAQNGNVITATVTSADAGSFALNLGTSGTIQSVAGWYAYDADQVFLPRAGGTFNITLGATPDAVTHITALPMRADLISVTGDGHDLDFVFNGRGDVKVAMADQGTSVIRMTGVDGASMAAGVATLSFGAVGDHSASIDYLNTAVAAGTAGNDFSFGSAAADTFGASAGNDTFFGGAGADMFLFAASSGRDTVLDFGTGIDKIELQALGYADANAAYAAFTVTGEGLMLSYSPDDSILLSGLDFNTFAASDILVI